MKGIEIAEKFYEEFGRPMLSEQFPDLLTKIAVGLVGSGSECLGFDDEISTDHDFEPGFCIFIPSEDIVDRKTAFQLERAYSGLPKEFMGLKRSNLSPVGGNRHGVIRIDEFLIGKVGCSDGRLTSRDWLTIPESYLLEATNGKIFFDGYGEFSRIRASLSNMPEDVRLKRLAGNLITMAQAGQYNYSRCLSHSETGAAQLAVCEFVKGAMAVIFLLNKKYQPYYKWSFRAMRQLDKFSALADTLEFLLMSENDEETSKTKALVIEDIVLIIIEELKNQQLTEAVCNDLERHAYSVNDKIADSGIRNLNIFAAV